jgi:Fic family protein
MTVESPSRLEPTRLDRVPAAISDAVAEVAGAAGKLGQALHPRTAASLADLVRVMNAYYSDLIEGHNTRPRDIERALAGELDVNEARRNQRTLHAECRHKRRITSALASSASPPSSSTARPARCAPRRL